jgi:maltooligosyltrehalose trehalohydrolase
VSQAKRALDNPALEATFAKCRLNLEERARHADKYQMHKDLLRLRREEPALVPRDERAGWYDGANLGPHAFLLRYFAERPADERLLLINLAADKILSPFAEPLAAPPQGLQWAVRWSSEDVIYGGAGTPVLHANAHWKLQGESALWLAPEKLAPPKEAD